MYMSKIFSLCISKRRVQKMKKSKLSVGLVTSFIGALALTACNETADVTSKDNSLVELVDYNGTSIEIQTDETYAKYSESSDGRKLYYDAILEALIRYEYKSLSENEEGLKSYNSLLKQVDDAVKSAKETANDNASTNGTTYDEEWNKILESHDCENEDDLKAYYLYNYEKEELSDWYAKSNIDTLKDEYIGVKSDWSLVPEAEKTENVNSLFPYHILHTLVTLSADKADYNRGTITSSEASNLWQTVRKLIDASYSFESIAGSDLNGDTGSKSAFGDVGIMTTKTSFYNEFKLGIYAYDAILSQVNEYNEANNGSIYDALGLNPDATVTTMTDANGGNAGVIKEKISDLIQEEMVDRVSTPVANGLANGYTQIPTVPYDVFRKIGELAEEDKINGLAPEAGDIALPRNVLYNQFLNFHSPFIITDEDIVDAAQNDQGGKIIDKDDGDPVDVVTTVAHDFANGDLKIANTNFVEMTINGEQKGVLCDKNGDVIVCVRSEAGIHFMLMRKSIFKATNEASGKAAQSLQNYYTTAIPGDEDFPATGETYVNMKSTDDQSYYKDRANDIKDAIKETNFDAAYDYRLYEYLVGNDLVKGKITYSDPKVERNIEEYIKLLREAKATSDVDSINNSWQTYLLMLRYQNNIRDDFENSLLPSTCAFHFNSENAAEFKEGGRCYVNK